MSDEDTDACEPAWDGYEPGTPQTLDDGTVNPNFSGVLRRDPGPDGDIDLVADPTAATLGTKCGPPAGYISFKGFMSDRIECEDGHLRRLYLDDTFWSWLEVREADVGAQIAVPPNGSDPRSVIWVRREARVTRSKVSEAYDLAEEVFGIDPGGITTRPPYR